MHSDIRKIQPVHASVVTVTKDDVKIEPVASHKYLFTTSTCPNCRVAKKILEGREFEIIDAEKNPEMVKEFGIMQAPTLVITDGEHMTKYVNTSNISMVSSNGPGADESNGRDAYFIDAGRLIIDKDKASIGFSGTAYR